ncbi:N-acetyl-D-glucosamine kinase [Anabrus simplex]|uniref:N-acetyl-D-glucosamine kinase n=1 Tax=Anabrus simplex TaxID=316456 RepID=UPI0034DCE572
MNVILGGIEGGATHSKVVLYNGKGEKMAEVSGPATNHWVSGMSAVQEIIYNMVNEAKKEANIPQDEPLSALGLSLSGCEEEETNRQLQEGLERKYPNLSKSYVVTSDTVGSIAVAREFGGMALIAGTGSNCLLLNPDGSVHRSGGWGHILGDEGGAWWISHKAMKVYFDDEDNYVRAPFNTDFVWEAIKRHFKVENRFELLQHCYSKFNKSYFAGLCKLLAGGAKTGDPLCLWLFSEAGRALASYVRALAPYAQPHLFPESGGLPVICVGSVWLSWEYLKPGFISRLQEPCVGKERPVEEVSLLTLTTTMATGAVYLAAKATNYDLPRDYSKNYKVFFHYKSNVINGE